jgi:hypothetical protein
LFGAVLSVALVVMLLLAFAMAMYRTRQTARAGEQEESLLYSHIPGTPAKLTVDSKGPVAVMRASAAAGAVAKKLSNLPA